MSKRKEGYYWVKLFSNVWVVGKWDYIMAYWTIQGSELIWSDSDFKKINETPLPPPTE